VEKGLKNAKNAEFSRFFRGEFRSAKSHFQGFPQILNTAAERHFQPITRNACPPFSLRSMPASIRIMLGFWQTMKLVLLQPSSCEKLQNAPHFAV
jgi:hypothetical protein